ncbi:DUF87 domain-containing protein [Patescibacteria group bacterium]|nr:DUF87 domain-containing protein [Patescibacteria group bacterium]
MYNTSVGFANFNNILNPVVHILLFILIAVVATLIIIAAVIIVLLFIFRDLKISNFIKNSKDFVTFEITIPRDNEVEISAADQMFSSLSGIKGGGFFDRLLGKFNYISFEIVATSELISFYVSSPDDISDLIEKQIHAAYPMCEVLRVERPDIFKNEGFVEFAQLGFSKKSFFPVKIYDQELKVDTLSHITSVISKLTDNEYAVYQLVIYPSAGKWIKKANKHTKPKSAGKDKPAPTTSASQEYVNQKITEKTQKSAFFSTIRLIVVSGKEERAQLILSNMVASFSQFSDPYSNTLKKMKLRWVFKKDFALGYLFNFPRVFIEFSKRAVILNTSELASLFHFPNKNVQTPHINWLLSKRAPVSSGVPTKGLFLGNGVYRGNIRPVCIADDDRRRHMYIVGRTGTGKSTFLESLILQDIKAGKGVAFLDPHGQSARNIIDRIPPERAEDVIYFNAADFERPMGFNLMEFYSEQDKHMIVNSFYNMLEKLFDPNKQGITGPRLERAVRNCMLTAMSKPGNTLIEVFRLVILDKKFIDEMVPFIKDDLVKKYWTEEMAQTSDYHKSETLGYFASKFDRFVINQLMRNILGQSKSSFNLREIMDNQKILIVDLDKGKIGEENSQFLGLLLVPKLLSAALSRSDLPEEQRKDFYLYVDEFQNFATDDFAQIMSESRKYKLNLTVANQYIAQMIDEVKNSVFGNVGSLVSFKVGVADAEFLEKEFEPIFDAEDLINLENQYTYVKMLSAGEVQPPFSMRTVMSDMKPDPEIGKAIIKLSRLKYGRNVEDIEAEIRSRGFVGQTPKPTFDDFLKQK